MKEIKHRYTRTTAGCYRSKNSSALLSSKPYKLITNFPTPNVSQTLDVGHNFDVSPNP